MGMIQALRLGMGMSIIFWILGQVLNILFSSVEFRFYIEHTVSAKVGWFCLVPADGMLHAVV